MSMTRRPEDLLDRRGGPVELLRLPALLFGAVAEARRALYDRGLLPSARLDLPIVCVGNLIAGGTGKTPLVVELARRLVAAGRRPGILSRGYGKGSGGADSDEARLVAELLPDLPRVAMPDRVEGARRLAEDGADLVLMDDGLQHRRLARDLDLVLVDATRPWGLARGPRAFLPRGLMREGPQALRRAGAVVLTRADQVPSEALEELELELGAWAPGVPRLVTRHAPQRLAPLVEDDAGPEGAGSAAPGAGGPRPEGGVLQELRGREVLALSAIGNPAAFARTLSDLGARVVEERRLPDHHAYTAADLAALPAGPGAPLVVTTAKDAVKLAPLSQRATSGAPQAADVRVLYMELEVTRGGDVLDALLAALPPGAAARQRAALHEGLHG